METIINTDNLHPALTSTLAPIETRTHRRARGRL